MTRDWQPVPADGVDDGLVLFDGVCVLCSGWVDFVIKRDPEARFRFLPIQSLRGREVAERFGVSVDEPETNVVVRNGLALFKLDTVLAITDELPGWRWVRFAGVLPRGLRNWLYNRIARNRYALFGKREVCRVPSADDARHMYPTGSGAA